MQNIKRLLIFSSVIILLIVFVNLSSAAEDPGDVSQVLGDEFGIDPDKIPTDPETIRQEYLKFRWTEFISNNRILGPIHRGLTKISIVFQILFAHPYEISLTLVGIIVLWFMILIHTGKMVESSELISGGRSFIIGLIGATIIAQTRIIKILVTFALDLTFKPDAWLWRLIIGVVVVGVIALIHIISKMIEKQLEKKHKKEIEQKSEQKLKDLEALSRGTRKIR